MTKLAPMVNGLIAMAYPAASAIGGAAAALATVGGILAHTSPVVLADAGFMLQHIGAGVLLALGNLQAHLLP